MLMFYIKDKIHGTIELSELAKSIIDTPEFQRLRRISQTGALSWVFHCATHNRFEHSIGVYYLSKLFAKNLTYESIIDDKKRLCEIIGIAGLIHDLGHLAYSHLFEQFLNADKSIFHHETLSQQLFTKICIEYEIKLSEDEKNNIIDIIHPNKKWKNGFIWKGVNVGKWVYQIVACPETGIDVDKFDYIVRDSVTCGIKTLFDYKRIIQLAKIQDGEIVFPWKLRYEIFDMYLSRYHLYTNLYNHKAVISVQILIVKIFKELNKKIDFINKIKNLDVIDITDNIIYDYTNDKIKDYLHKIDTRQYPKLLDKEDPDVEHILQVNNSMCSENKNPLTRIKYIDSEDNIKYAKIKEYGILASQSYSDKIILHFSK